MQVVKKNENYLELHCGMIEFFMQEKTVAQVVHDLLVKEPKWKPYIERVKPLYAEKYNIFTMLVRDFPAITVGNGGEYLIPFELEIINPKVIVVNGRSWFCKSVGGSYYSASIEMDGKSVEGVGGRGYGSDYVWAAFHKLAHNRLITPMNHNEAPWTWGDRNGVIISYQITQVPRKKDW